MTRQLTAVQKKIEALTSKKAKLVEEKAAARQELKDSLDEKQAERVRMIEAELADIQEILTAAREREQELIEEEKEAQRQADFKSIAEMENQASDIRADILRDIEAMFKKFESLEELSKRSQSLTGRYGTHGFERKDEYLRVFDLYRGMKDWKAKLEYYHRHVKLGMSR